MASSSSSIPQIKADIENTKGQISSTIEELEDIIHEVKDWQGLVRRNPWISVAISFGAGIILSGATAPLVRYGQGYVKNSIKATLIGLVMHKVQDKIGQSRNQSSTVGSTYSLNQY
jgi:hypothetical protein